MGIGVHLVTRALVMLSEEVTQQGISCQMTPSVPDSFMRHLCRQNKPRVLIHLYANEHDDVTNMQISPWRPFSDVLRLSPGDFFFKKVNCRHLCMASA